MSLGGEDGKEGGLGAVANDTMRATPGRGPCGFGCWREGAEKLALMAK